MPPKQPNMPGFGETLRSMRKKHGMTMGDMARAVGERVTTVSDLELGRGGTVDLANRFVQALRERGLDPKAALLLDACAAIVPWGRTSEGGEP